MLLTLWRILRLSIAQIDKTRNVNLIDTLHSLPPEYPTHFQPAEVVVESVMSALNMYGEIRLHVDVTSTSLVEASGILEERYMQWMHQICDRRDVWDVGLSMTKILEEYF